MSHFCVEFLEEFLLFQELHQLEVDLEKTQHQQTEKENALAMREAELQKREMELFEREFQMAMIQQQTPTPKKRKSHFKKKFKDKKSSGSNIISGPSGKSYLQATRVCYYHHQLLIKILQIFAIIFA